MIPKWIAKAIVQKGISFFPKKEKLNYMFQKYITKGVALSDEYFTNKITHAIDHINYFRQYSKKGFNDCSVLELGSGWYPVVPIVMYLNDFKEIISIDIQSWMTKKSQLTTIEKFIEWRNKNMLDKYLPNISEIGWNTLIDIINNKDNLNQENINKTLRLSTVIQDAGNTEFENNSIDFICSNNTFEHIPKNILLSILSEFIRIIKNEGVMSHFIDMSDHFAHFDKRISIYNFLKFSQKSWKRIDNDIQPQNRMRFKDYKEIYRSLKIPITDEDFRNGDPETILKIKLDPMYSNYYTPQELAVSHASLISKILK